MKDEKSNQKTPETTTANGADCLPMEGIGAVTYSNQDYQDLEVAFDMEVNAIRHKSGAGPLVKVLEAQRKFYKAAMFAGMPLPNIDWANVSIPKSSH